MREDLEQEFNNFIFFRNHLFIYSVYRNTDVIKSEIYLIMNPFLEIRSTIHFDAQIT